MEAGLQKIQSIISTEGYSFSYPASERPALSDISFDIEPGSFTLLCGKSGCGKTTLLRSIKPELTPYGKASGKLLFNGAPIASIDRFVSAVKIGFVMQNPDNQLVTDTVAHEMAFGLENIGLPTEIIRRRLAETANFFGISSWFNQRVSEISGGQKQILNLASVTVLKPEILLLDEPTAQLDPIAAGDFLTMLNRLHKETGTTILICEHNLEEVLPMADKVLFMEKSLLKFTGTAQEFIRYTYDTPGNHFTGALPAASQIAFKFPPGMLSGMHWPVTVADGIQLLRNVDMTQRPESDMTLKTMESRMQALLRAENLWFRYDAGSPFILQGIDFSLYSNTIHAVIGGNGSGKSTLLLLLASVYRPVRGRIKKEKGLKISMLPQNPLSLFVYDTLTEDLMETAPTEEAMMSAAKEFGLTDLLDRHPHDLSGGEAERAAIAKLWLLSPDILLLDEPTKGLDIFTRNRLGELLAKQKNKGLSIVLVTHDLEFAATYADTCSLLFNGEITGSGPAETFFCENNFYTTSVNRIVRKFGLDYVTVKDTEKLWNKK